MVNSVNGKAMGSPRVKPVPGDSALDWTSTLKALQIAQDLYSNAKKQVDELHCTFAEIEARVSHNLRSFISDCEIGPEPPIGLTRKAAALSRINTKKAVPLTAMRVYCLGSFHLFLNGEKIERWHSQKARSLLKYLLTRRNKAGSRDELIEALWPNCDVEIGRNNLKAAVYSLRQTLAACNSSGDISHIILFQEGQYSINPDIDIQVDIDDFERCWQTGRKLEREGRKMEAVNQYTLAEEIYKGDYFEDEPYSEWTLLQREALKDNYLSILGKLAAWCYENGDYESCMHYSQSLLYKDICHEEAYRWLIKCNIALEQYNRAHRWFKICSEVLRRELDIAPDQKTLALYYHLVQITTGKNMFSPS